MAAISALSFSISCCRGLMVILSFSMYLSRLRVSEGGLPDEVLLKTLLERVEALDLDAEDGEEVL